MDAANPYSLANAGLSLFTSWCNGYQLKVWQAVTEA